MYPTTYQNKDDAGGVYFFSSPYDALNNWSAHVIEVDGRTFYTVEHAYHYLKFSNNPDIAEKVAMSPSPWAAKQIADANKQLTRADWHQLKVEIMFILLKAKYTQNEDVRMVLRQTGERPIIENSPWDSFWGCGADGKGANTLGQLWMRLRQETMLDFK